jgi:hypothetical protein
LDFICDIDSGLELTETYKIVISVIAVLVGVGLGATIFYVAVKARRARN